MERTTFQKAVTVFYVIAIPLAAVVGYTLLIKPQMPAANAYSAEELDGMLALADQAIALESGPRATQLAQNNAEAGPPRGAPIDAPVEGGDGNTARPPAAGGVISSIPQESLDLIEQAEKLKAPADENGEMRFQKTQDGKYFKVGFSQLGGYEFDLPMPKELREAEDPEGVITQRIPEPIQELDGEPVVVVGFMVPVEITREGRLKSFALTQNQAFCCYGVPPKINEWIMVTAAEAIELETRLDVPVACYGNMEVGGDVDDGYVLGIYRMEAQEVIDVKELLRRVEDSATGGGDRFYGE